MHGLLTHRKSSSVIPIISSAPAIPSTDINQSLNWFRDELSKFIENSLGVQIKPSRSSYHNAFLLRFFILKISRSCTFVSALPVALYLLLPVLNPCFFHCSCANCLCSCSIRFRFLFFLVLIKNQALLFRVWLEHMNYAVGS